MYGVIRFVDTPLLPASSPEDYPKIIKSGIDEEGQHPKSPAITGPSGIATLLHRIGRPQLLERLLDVEGTYEYNLFVRPKHHFVDNLYLVRKGRLVEFGFKDSQGPIVEPAVRYRIEPKPTESPYRVGKWIPISTLLDSQWGGDDAWVRGQGSGIAKGIWWNELHNRPDVTVSWSGMDETEKEDLAAWLKERKTRLEELEKIAEEEWEEFKRKYGDDYLKVQGKEGMLGYYKSRLVCRAQCGEENPRLTCSKCKLARYCNQACQAEDWKYHKTYCGMELSIPQEYRNL